MNSDVVMLVNRNGGDCIRNVLLAAEEIYSISILCWSPIHFRLLEFNIFQVVYYVIMSLKYIDT